MDSDRSPEREQAAAHDVLALAAAVSRLVERAEKAERAAQEMNEAQFRANVKVTDLREQLAAAVGRERELTRALGVIAAFIESRHKEGDTDYQAAIVAREALAGGVSAAGRPPEQDLGGNAVAVAEAGKPPWRGEMRFCFVAESQDEAGDILDAATAAMESLGVFAEGGSCEVMDDGDVLAESPLAAALTAATALQRSHQEVDPAAVPEVLPEETP